MMATMTTRIRQLTAADVPFALEQTRREGWSSAAHWFAALIEHDPALCVVAEDGAAPVGMITATRFGRSAWIGNLIVVPEQRRTGLGTRLMERTMDALAALGVRTIRLEADPPGVNIYRRLGFADEFDSLRFRRTGAVATLRSHAVELGAEHVADLLRFDREPFGDDRGRLLGVMRRHAKGAWICVDTDGIRGYAMAVETTGGLHIGPWVAADEGAAADLLGACLALQRGRDVRVGLPAGNDAGCALLRAMGFLPTEPSLRMVWGDRVATGQPERIYGILNGAVG